MELLNIQLTGQLKQNIFFKSEMAANLCPPQPRMNVEILLSACNSPNKLGPAGKIIVGFKIAYNSQH